MKPLLFQGLEPWATALSVVAHLLLGVALGIFHFRSLHEAARRMARGARAAPTIALMVGRWVLLGVALVLASLEGALPLGGVALGILAARAWVMRSVGKAAP